MRFVIIIFSKVLLEYDLHILFYLQAPGVDLHYILQAETENQATEEGSGDVEDHEDSDLDDMDGWIWTTED